MSCIGFAGAQSPTKLIVMSNLPHKKTPEVPVQLSQCRLTLLQPHCTYAGEILRLEEELRHVFEPGRAMPKVRHGSRSLGCGAAAHATAGLLHCRFWSSRS